MQFKISGKDPVTKVLWPEESVYKATGGFTLDKTNLKDGTDFLEKGSLMAVDFTTRSAKLVKTAKVHADAAADALQYPVKKNHHFKVGNILAKTKGGAANAITEIITSNADYDLLVLETTIGAVTAGDVLFQSSATGADAAAEANVANSILIHDTSLEEYTTVNVGLQIFEIIESNLPYAVTSYNKESLTSRFLFV